MERNGLIERDGFELAYRIEGEGTPVLVVGSAVYYPRLFSERMARELQLIFIDHRGFVRPPRALQPADYTLDVICDDIEAVRKALGLDEFVVMGHSGHAFMAMEYVKKYPAHAKKVVLLNTAPSNNEERQRGSFAYFDSHAEPARKRKFEQDMSQLASDIEKDPERRFAHLLIRMGAQSFYDYSTDASWMWQGVYTNMQIIDYLWGDAFARLNLIDSLTSVDKPVFLGLGRHDYLVAPVTLWDSIDSRFSHVKKVVFERSGHNPMFEEPALFDETLISWIKDGV